MPDLYKEAGLHIRAGRRRLGLTLEDLEERSGLSASYIGQIERNVKKASLLSLGILADALGVEVSTFFGPQLPVAEVPVAARIEAILDSSTPREKKVILTAVRHLARGLKDLRRPHP